MPTKSPGSPEYGSRIEIIVTGLKFIGIQRDCKIYVEEFCTRLLCARARACVCVCVCERFWLIFNWIGFQKQLILKLDQNKWHWIIRLLLDRTLLCHHIQIHTCTIHIYNVCVHMKYHELFNVIYPDRDLIWKLTVSEKSIQLTMSQDARARARTRDVTLSSE